MLTAQRLGPTAIDYIRDQLGQGVTLAEHLLRLPLSGGTVVAYLPAGVEIAADLSLEESFAYATGIPIPSDYRERIASMMLFMIERVPRGCAVFETPWSPSDAFMRRVRLRHFSHREHVYVWLDGQSTLEDAHEAIRQTSSYPFVCAITRWRDDETAPLRGGAATDETLAQLAQNTRYLLIGAFDDEGHVIWSAPHAAALAPPMEAS